MTAHWDVLVHELIFTSQAFRPLPLHDLQWQQRFISRKLRARFYKCTWTHTQRLAANNCLGSSPPWFHPPHSPGWEHWSRGAEGNSLAKWPVFWGGLWWKAFTGKGSALLEVWDINGNAFSVQQQAAGAFLYLPLLIPSTTERQCQRNTYQEYFQERMAETIAIQSSRSWKPGNAFLCISLDLW